ncbi:hypothetical protein ABT039_22940 [Streptomyces lasiicapitis]|uniref:hypothetical protein n=1 Tax=Streptomyces lasiicapitis TaxID=1923961 RepID=UPI0033179014
MTKAAVDQPVRADVGHGPTKRPAPHMAQAIEAVRQIDCDGEAHWFCSRTGTRIQTLQGGHDGYFCPGCNAVAPRIERVRSFRS